MKSLLERYFLNKYLPRESEEFFQAQVLVLSHIALIFLMTLVLFVTSAPPQVMLLMLGILLLSLVSIIFLRFGFLTMVTVISFSGMGLLATLAMLGRVYYNNFEVYALVSFHMFITIIASLLTQQRRYTFFTTTAGVLYIVLLFFVRGLRAATPEDPLEIDDYIIGSVLLIMAGFIMQSTLDRRKRLLDIAESESKRSLEKALELEQSLKEKEILLNEVHHRVKNNLNVAISLLNMQIRKLDVSNVAVSTLNASIGRLNAMALVHERLYASEDMKAIEFKPYIIAILQTAMRSQDRSWIDFKVHVDAEIWIDLTKAVPCGLIINELITNVYQHAFPAESTGQAHISLTGDGKNRATLIVSDDGVGMPEYAGPGESSLGLNVVSLLTEQLLGTIEIDGRDGMNVKITFPLS